jgi:hypothetical protein
MRTRRSEWDDPPSDWATPLNKDRLLEVPRGWHTASGDGTDLPSLITDVAQRGFEWRDTESRRLADRAAGLLSAASVVLGVGAGLATTQVANAAPMVPVAVGVLFYLGTVFTCLLVLYSRPLGRTTGYAVEYDWTGSAALHRFHQLQILARVGHIDQRTSKNARLLFWGYLLLAGEVVAIAAAFVTNLPAP